MTNLLIDKCRECDFCHAENTFLTCGHLPERETPCKDIEECPKEMSKKIRTPEGSLWR